MPIEEFAEIAETGWLNRKQCRRLWRMQDRQDKPPHRLQVFLKRDDVEAMIKREDMK
jgi:hypothetical protein